MVEEYARFAGSAYGGGKSPVEKSDAEPFLAEGMQTLLRKERRESDCVLRCAKNHQGSGPQEIRTGREFPAPDRGQNNAGSAGDSFRSLRRTGRTERKQEQFCGTHLCGGAKKARKDCQRKKNALHRTPRHCSGE